MAALDYYTIGVKTSRNEVPTTRVSISIALDDQTRKTYWFDRETALDIAARLIQACTAIAPIDLTDILKEATSG